MKAPATPTGWVNTFRLTASGGHAALTAKQAPSSRAGQVTLPPPFSSVSSMMMQAWVRASASPPVTSRSNMRRVYRYCRTQVQPASGQPAPNGVTTMSSELRVTIFPSSTVRTMGGGTW